MYHMAMPPHYGAASHPQVMHPSIFPGPLLPPGSHSQNTMHQYPCQSVIEKPTAPVLHNTASSNSMVISGSHPYQQQPAVYVDPYLQHHTNHIHHVPQMPVHAHLQGFPIQNPSSNALIMAGTTGNHGPQEYSYSHDQRQPLTIDEELFEDITTSHLGYLETEDSPQKMEQREKLENLIMEYLSITPHTHKFTFKQVLNVLEQSINTRSDFSAHDAACAFDALAHYAANLISQPWRKEFREIKLYNGFWVHQVSSHLIGAESILELIGYTGHDSSKIKKSAADCHSTRNHPSQYILEGVLDPDLISRLALDCMIAYCELQCLNKIKDGVSDYGLTWSQILQFRQMYLGGIDITLRQLLFTLRQRITPLAYSSAQSPGSLEATSPPPPLPVRQSSSPYVSSKPTTPTSLTTGMSNKLSLMKGPSIENFSNSTKVCINNTLNGESSMLSSRKPRMSSDIPDEGPLLNRCSVTGVPTARLIDLDISHENLPHHPHTKSTQHLLPKVLPHKAVPKSSSHLHYSLPTEPVDLVPPPLESPIEAFQAGTLEEHLEATLNLVNNPGRNNSTIRSNPGSRNNPHRNSLESWDFVFRGLEKKGYTKDIGDRGDILHEIFRQKNNFSSDTINNSSAIARNIVESISQNNVNVNSPQVRKESVKNRPLTINQALQQLSLNETKERADNNDAYRNDSVARSYSQENRKRSSLYDNLSGGGFETAPQSSSEEYGTVADHRIPNHPLPKINNNVRTDNTTSSRSSSDSLRNDMATGGSRKRDPFTSKSVKNISSNFGLNSSPTGNVGKNNASNDYAPTHEATGSDKDIPDGVITSASRQSFSSSTWSCSTCTFLNPSGKNVCDMCGKSRDPGPDMKPLVSGGKQCPACTLINDRDVAVCSACGANLKGSSTYI